MGESLSVQLVYRLIDIWMTVMSRKTSRDFDWDSVQEGDFLDIPGFDEPVEVVEKVDDYSREGGFDNWSQPIWVVLRIGDRFFQAIGKNVSHSGTDWDFYQFREVTFRKVTHLVWDRKED